VTAADDLRVRLREGLQTAMRARDAAAVSALRATMAAIDNAEAADLTAAPPSELSEHVAGGVAGLGAGEVSRRLLTVVELRALIATEIAERHQQAAEYETMGHLEQSQRLRAEAAALEPFSIP
jgi:hypothetical protein